MQLPVTHLYVLAHVRGRVIGPPTYDPRTKELSDKYGELVMLTLVIVVRGKFRPGI